MRVDEGSIRVDGRLDEAAWSEAPALTDFVQKEREESAEPAAKTEVRFVYKSGGPGHWRIRLERHRRSP